MGDALDASEQAMYNFDTTAVHTAFMQTIEDNQGVDGDVPVVIPQGSHRPGDSCNDIAWTSAYPQLINMMHTYHGDVRLAERHWPSLVDYQENLIQHAASNPQHLAECDQFADWLCGNAQSCCTGVPANSSCPVGKEMGAFNYVLGLKAMAEMATTMGDAGNATRYAALAEAATGGFHAAFFNPQLDAYGGDAGAVQTLTTPALAINSPPTNLYSTVVATLEKDLVQTTGYLPYVGAVTSKILLNVLSDNGLHTTALQTAASTAEPSWGYWWTQNSTTCWESWPIGHGTRNHIFLCGGVVEWMWKHLVGLTPAAPQFASVTVAPKVHPLLGPTSTSSTFASASGTIASSWRVEDGGKQIALNVSLPVGVQHATVVVPKPFVQVPAPAVTRCTSDSERQAPVFTLSCGSALVASTIASVDWAAYGTPTPPTSAEGCNGWKVNATCNANQKLVESVVTKACVGRTSCSISLGVGGNNSFGPDPCSEVVKTLAVVATCSRGTSANSTSTAIVTESGSVVWQDGKLVGTHPGLVSASDAGTGIAFEVTNGAFHFRSH
jgi:hypothetical protein